MTADRHGVRKRLALSSNVSAFFLTFSICAILFATIDAYRTYSLYSERAQMAARIGAAQIVPDSAHPASTPSRPANLAVAGAFILTAGDGEVLASSLEEIAPGSDYAPEAIAESYLLVEAPVTRTNGAFVVAVPYRTIVQDMSLRGAVPAGLVLTICGIAFWVRRRRNGKHAVLISAMSALPMGLAHWNAKGKLISANSRIANLLHMSPKMTEPGQDYSAFSAAIGGKITLRPVLDKRHQRLVEIEREDGSTVLLDERPCADGGFVTVVTDITERRAADRMLRKIREEQHQLARRYREEKLRAEAASRTKTSFLAHLSHDIRTPLNHIIGFAEMIRHETFGPLGNPRYRNYVSNICDAGEKLLASFSEILEFAELEGGRKTLRCDDVAVCDLLDLVVARHGTRIANKGIALEIGERADVMLHADCEALERMIGNVVDNAIRFTPRGGEIRLAAWQAEDGVVLEISDSGTGMDRAKLAELSEPFVLSDVAFTRTHDGVGLGIAIARAIAELSGGKLLVDSVEGVGTTVAISLPAKSAAGSQIVPQSIQKARAA